MFGQTNMKWEEGGRRGELIGSRDSIVGQNNMLTVNIQKTLTNSHPQTFMLHLVVFCKRIYIM